MPWRNEPVGIETNLAFHLENNLLFLPSVTIDGRPGRYIFGSANVRSVLDPRVAGSTAAHSVTLSGKDTFNIKPVVVDLRGIADGIVGADVIARNAVTIDYRSQIVTYQKEGIHPELMTLYPYNAEPSVTVNVDGVEVSAIVDTTSPDTLVLPRRNASRSNVRVRVAGIDFGSVDVQYANVARARIGNRLLSKFLVSIDYGKRVVGLWRDPRMS
ncbi:MAG TPA: hypothetical protein VN181_13020 [Thermoanaerobaculia bacterium]|nr:hypothetical protein [Thermoanaerobaculia bacterium]